MDELFRLEETDFLNSCVKDLMWYVVTLKSSIPKRIAAMKKGHERINYILSVLSNQEEYLKIINVTKSNKDNDLSEKLRTDGNKLYQRKEFKEALIYYTKSIQIAEYKSVQQALGYGNRSAWLFEREYYEECARDIERAFECDCPEDIKERLEERKTKANQAIRRRKRVVYYWPYPPFIRSQHRDLKGVAGGVEIKENSDLGRHIVAIEPFNVGDIISKERPFAHQICADRYMHCHECLHPCVNLLPCKKCTVALYCNEICLYKAHKRHHKYECDVPFFGKTGSLLLRTFLIVQAESKYSSIGPYAINAFQEIEKLCTNEAKRNPLNILFTTISTLICFAILKNNTKVLVENRVSDNDAMDILFKLGMIVSSNYMKQYKIHHLGSTEALANALYAFSSLYNHSCAPNCFISYIGEHFVVQAMEKIKPGQEITISYGVTYDRNKLALRQSLLQSTYHFKCRCKACLGNWDLPKIRLYSAEFKRVMPPVVASHVEFWLMFEGKEHLPYDFVHKAKGDIGYEIEKYNSDRPNDYLTALKQFYSEIIRYTGNKVFDI